MGQIIIMIMRRYFLILVMPLLLCCCHSEKNYPVADEECMLWAEIEGVAYTTRSQIAPTGIFSWTDDDLIGICGHTIINQRFHYIGGSSSENVFSGVFDVLSDSIRFGYYPYQKDIVIRGDSLHFTIGKEAEFRNDVNYAPMIGFLSGKNTMLFKQAGGLMRLSFKGFTKEMSKVVVESVGESRPRLSGNAVMHIGMKSNPCFRIDTGSYGREFDITFLDKDTSTYKLLVPFQVGEYSMIRVSIVDNNSDTVISRALSDVVMERAKLIDVELLDCNDN